MIARETLEHWLDRIEEPLSWWLLWVGVLGFGLAQPLWAFGVLSEWMMLGVTLVLSFAALWYAAIIAVEETRHANELRAMLEGFMDDVCGRLEMIEEKIDDLSSAAMT